MEDCGDVANDSVKGCVCGEGTRRCWKTVRVSICSICSVDASRFSAVDRADPIMTKAALHFNRNLHGDDQRLHECPTIALHSRMSVPRQMDHLVGEMNQAQNATMS